MFPFRTTQNSGRFIATTLALSATEKVAKEKKCKSVRY
jgi:hypothetical protein